MALLASCSSDSDSLSLGNGLAAEIPVANDNSSEAVSTDEPRPGFLGSAPATEEDTTEAGSAAQTAIAASPGVGGIATEQPLDDQSQAGISPSLGQANPQDDAEILDLSDDILIAPDAPILEISADAGELVFTWEATDSETLTGEIEYGIDMYDSITRESITESVNLML